MVASTKPITNTVHNLPNLTRCERFCSTMRIGTLAVVVASFILINMSVNAAATTTRGQAFVAQHTTPVKVHQPKVQGVYAPHRVQQALNFDPTSSPNVPSTPTPGNGNFNSNNNNSGSGTQGSSIPQPDFRRSTSLLKTTLVRSRGPLPPANLTPTSRRSNRINEDDDMMGGSDESADDEGEISDMSEGGELWLLLQRCIASKCRSADEHPLFPPSLFYYLPSLQSSILQRRQILLLDADSDG